jgi:serine/threonine protein kinase
MPPRLGSCAHDEEKTRELHTTVCGYRIGPLVGRGGSSVVFQVTHPTVVETLAMKIITDRHLQSDLAFDAIYKHANAIAALSNRHIVRTLDAGRLPTGEPFVVMERLDGEDLAAHLAGQGPLRIEEAVRFVMQACDGLAQAHAAGIVHGDIKPGNLVVAKDAGGDSILKIVDFAPSVPRACDPNDPLITCSPGYASPEQLGARADVDGRADVWALGIVLYELVTGRRAFEATTLPEMLRVMGRPTPVMRSPYGRVPASLEAIVRRCVLRDRELRFETVLQLRAALMMVDNEVLATEAIATPALPSPRVLPVMLTSIPTPRARVRRKPPSRLPRLLFLGALGPACALVSMTLVRLVLASNLFAPTATSSLSGQLPPQWPAAAPLDGPVTSGVLR